ncbi:hypothetical protein [Globicatella sanguinis]|uniref:hypothetical protein n=1 Tax=Globicatella sanguinis TaxID=13076 RepID=UPI000823FADB|nr:hypothetical protein [Globicatella sanguinis]
MVQLHKSTGLRWRTYRYIEGIIQDLDIYETLINKRTTELLTPYMKPDENIGGGRSSITINPTEQSANALAEDGELNQLVKEYDAATAEINKMLPEHRKVIEMAYINKPKTLTWQGIALECNYSPKHCYWIRDQLIIKIAKKLKMR